MGLFRRPKLPAAVEASLARGEGERLLAVARDERTGGYLVATTTRLAALPEVPSPGADIEPGPVLERLIRPWHEVSAGSWEPMTSTISVTWVDGGRAGQWSLRDGGGRFPQVFYERVQASVVISGPVELGGRTLGQAAIRRDLATGEHLRQIAWGRGARRNDPQLDAQAQLVLADLAEQSGLA